MAPPGHQWFPVIRAANDPSVFTITEKALTRALSWLKAPSSSFTFKTLLRHYAKRVLAHGKYTRNWDAVAKVMRDWQVGKQCKH